MILAALLGVGEVLTRPAQRSVGAPPPDLGAQSVTFAADTGATIHGWLATGRSGAPVVLLLHPSRGDRRAMLGRARFLRGLGYHVLLVDLPAHGESSGERITFGLRESTGVAAALGFLRERMPGAAVGVVGVSLGGASLLLAEPAPRVDAVVLEAVYPELDTALANRLRMRLGYWGGSLSPVLSVQLWLRFDVASERMRPVDRVGALQAPVLIVSGELDRHTTTRDTERLFAAAGSPKSLWIVPGAGHIDLHRFAQQEYEARIGDFLARHLERPG